MVPFYLLEVESNQYPVYIDNSNIDKSLTEDYTINSIHINMSDSILFGQQIDYENTSRVKNVSNRIANDGVGRLKSKSDVQADPSVRHG